MAEAPAAGDGPQARGGFLSDKPIPSRERLIFALDVPTVMEAETLVSELGDSVEFYKIGLQLFLATSYAEFVDRLVAKGKKILADLKLFDIERTVYQAVRQLRDRGIAFVTVHGNDAILRAACEASNGVKVLAVTVLTSLDQRDIEDLGFETTIEKVVRSRAKRALEIGCDGVISSGLEAVDLRESLGQRFLIVVPGVRPSQLEPHWREDQKRVVDVEKAFLNGADYIVVGRPIRRADSPREAAEAIQARISTLFERRAGSR